MAFSDKVASCGIFTDNRNRAVFIDHSNIANSLLQSMPGHRLNYIQIYNYLQPLVARTYIVSYEQIRSEKQLKDERYLRFLAFMRWLKNSSFQVSKKSAYRYNTATGREKISGGNADVEIAVDAMMLLISPHKHIDEFVLFSGDGDFTYLLLKLNEFGIYTVVIAHSRHTAISLRDACQKFLPIEEYDIFLDTISTVETVETYEKGHGIEVKQLSKI